MTIPEPTANDDYDLCYLYEDQQNCIQPDKSKCSLIRRAYHAERERYHLKQWKDQQTKFHTELLSQYEKLENEADRLRARVAELEAKGVTGE